MDPTSIIYLRGEKVITFNTMFDLKFVFVAMVLVLGDMLTTMSLFVTLSIAPIAVYL